MITMSYPHNGRTVSGETASPPDGDDLRGGISALRWEIRHLQEAVVPRAAVDQDIGAAITVGGLCTDQGSELLTTAARRTGIGLRAVADHLVEWVAREQLPNELRTALGAILETARADARPAGIERAQPVGDPVAVR